MNKLQPPKVLEVRFKGCYLSHLLSMTSIRQHWMGWVRQGAGKGVGGRIRLEGVRQAGWRCRSTKRKVRHEISAGETTTRKCLYRSQVRITTTVYRSTILRWLQGNQVYLQGSWWVDAGQVRAGESGRQSTETDRGCGRHRGEHTAPKLWPWQLDQFFTALFQILKDALQKEYIETIDKTLRERDRGWKWQRMIFQML